MIKIAVLIAAAAGSCTPLASNEVTVQEAPVCESGYAPVTNASGETLCVNPIYLDPPFQHPSECLGGYYQGSCVQLRVDTSTAQGCNEDGTQWAEFTLDPNDDAGGEWIVQPMYGDPYYVGPVQTYVHRLDGLYALTSPDGSWYTSAFGVILYYGRAGDKGYGHNVRIDVPPLVCS